MSQEISIRQWQQKYANGEFAAPDHSTQCKAGWYDWFCEDYELASRLKELSGIVMGIKDPYILDNYYVWFKNNCPMDGDLYDDVRFDPLGGERNGRYFMVAVDSPHEDYSYALYTERGGFDTPEFQTNDMETLIGYINDLGVQLSAQNNSEDAAPDLADFEADGVGETEQNAGEAEMGGPQL